MRRAQKTKPKLTGSKKQALIAKGYKQSLTAQRATRRAQRGKRKLNTQRVFAQSAGEPSNTLGSSKSLAKRCTKFAR